MHHLNINCQSISRSVLILTTCYARLFYTLWSSKMPLHLLSLTYCRIGIFRALRQSFCGKFQIVCGFWNPANPAFRMNVDGIGLQCTLHQAVQGDEPGQDSPNFLFLALCTPCQMLTTSEYNGISLSQAGKWSFLFIHLQEGLNGL